MGVVALHGRDIAKVARHPFPVNHKRKVSRENVLAQAIAIEPGNIRQRVHDLMREAVQKQVDVSGNRPGRLPRPSRATA